MTDYHPALPYDDLPEGRAVGVVVDGQRLVVVRLAGAVYAMRNRCAHAAARFDRVPAVNFTLTCPMHGAKFDLRDGHCVNSPYDPIDVFPARIRDGMVEIAAAPALD